MNHKLVASPREAISMVKAETVSRYALKNYEKGEYRELFAECFVMEMKREKTASFGKPWKDAMNNLKRRK